jgi:mono/diheme cytochrome c family protein
MRRARYAIGSLAPLLALGVACRPSSERGGRDFERMRRQQRYDLYDTSAFFANGAAMQAPPAHTVSRESGPGAPRGVDGAAMYQISCAPCHGAGGFGGGPIAPNLDARRPPSLRVPPAATLDTAAIVAVITSGFGRMPPLGWQLPPAARSAVAAYVKTLTTAPTTAAVRDDSALAARLALIDSLRASKAAIGAILRAEPDSR